jgi:hypothetical protein
MPFEGLAEPFGTASEGSGRYLEPFGSMLSHFGSLGVERAIATSYFRKRYDEETFRNDAYTLLMTASV